MAGLVHSSIALSTWSRFTKDWRTLKSSQLHARTKFTSILSKQTSTGHCLVEKKLKPSSVKTFYHDHFKIDEAAGNDSANPQAAHRKMWVMGMYLRMSMQELLLILIKRINL
jgi:hypothetical protein